MPAPFSTHTHTHTLTHTTHTPHEGHTQTHTYTHTHTHEGMHACIQSVSHQNTVIAFSEKYSTHTHTHTHTSWLLKLPVYMCAKQPSWIQTVTELDKFMNMIWWSVRIQKQRWLPAFWKEIQNTQEFKRMLFDKTKQDKSSFSIYVQQKTVKLTTQVNMYSCNTC